MSIKVKRGLAINLPTLEEGELGFTTDSYEMYVGSDNGNILLNNGEILIRRNNGMLQYAQSSRKNQWFDICSLEEIRGDQGIQGIQGIQGVKGDKGDKGERGIQGEKGNPFTYADFTPDQLRALKGEKGDTGAKGERGLTGDKGDRGIGLNYAWSGTRLGVKRDTDAQYTYVDLRGADGKDGKQGERGERGIQGEKGDTPSIAHLEQQVSDKSKELDIKFNTLTAKQQQDAEVVTARDGEVSLHARLERDLEKGKIHFVDVEGSNIATESEEGYLENVEIYGNTWQDAENLADIRSVGTKVEGQELYEIPVLSCGKNLFNINEDRVIVKGISLNDSFRVIDNAVEFATPYFVIGSNIVGYKINVKPNTDYKFNFNVDSGKCAVRFYNENLEEIIYNNNPNFTFNSGNSNVVYLQFTSNTWNDLTRISNIQLEEGTLITPFEPYQGDKLTILSPVPLEKVGDIADRIICKDGVWGVEKNVKTKILQRANVVTTNWLNREYATGCLFKYEDELPIANSKYGVLSDVVSSEKYHDMYEKDIEGITVYSNTVYGIILKIAKARLGGLTILEYIEQNPITVKYALVEPVFIPLPHDQQVKLRTFADRTNISFLTEIEGTIKAQVPKSLGATVNTHTTQIDNLNKELDRVKKLEESTVSTVTTSKAFTTVAETTGGYFEDVKIEGKTLVNRFINIHLMGRNYTYDAETKTLKTSINGSDDSAWSNITSLFDVVEGKEYTLIFNVLDDTVKVEIKNDVNEKTIRGTFTTGLNVLKFTAIGTKFLLKVSDPSRTAQKRISNMMLLEGDHTDKDLNFFEGLKSVGQDSDEISVESVNENLFDLYKHNTLRQVNDYIEATSYANHFVEYSLLPNTDYTLSFDKYNNNTCWVAVVVDGYNVVNNNNANFCKTYRTGINGILRISIRANGSNDIGHKIKNVMLTQGTTPKPYTPHQSNKKTLLYYNPNTQTWEKPVLREWDSIEKHSDGKYYYHKRSGEAVLNGSENWKLFNKQSTQVDISTFTLTLGGDKANSQLICDKFARKDYRLNEEFIYIGGTPTWIIGISNSKLFSQDVAGFKAWLQNNNVTVVYQLAQEEVYECTNLDLITYTGETNLIVSSGAIQPKLELKVLSNVSNVVKLLQEKVSILENKFIKGLQQVLAGDMMSLAHLLYPEDFTLENDTPQVIPYIEEGDINE